MATVKWHVEVYRGRKVVRQAFRVRLRYTLNHRKLMASEAYTNREDAFDAARDVAEPAGAEVIDLT